MVIYEHVKGTISIPCYNDSGDYAGYTSDIAFTEKDIIKDSCSITSRACDDTTFSLGGVRPAELSIKLKLEGSSINAYNLYGAKIVLYSCYKQYPNTEDWVLRGIFWVTSVSRVKTMYTLRASDALVWLSSNSISSGSGKVDDDESEVSKKLREKLEGFEESSSGGFYTLHTIVNDITAWTNDILQNTIAEKPLIYRQIEEIPNNNPQSGDSYSGYTLMRKTVEGESKNTRYSAIDYISALAQVACSFVCTRNDLIKSATDASQIPFSVIPFGFFTQKLEIPFSSIALDGSDVASYRLYIQKVHFKTYDGVGWTCSREYKPLLGNIEIDMSNNSFLDGRRMETVLNYQELFPDTNDKNEYVVANAAAAYLFNNVLLIPFKIKCYMQFEKADDFPKLGQRISIEYKKDEWVESTITSMTWKFRGGWEFSCTGKDTRVLAQAAKRSLAFNAENASKRHADIATASAKRIAQIGIKEAKDSASAAWNYASEMTYQSDFDALVRRVEALENRI